MDTADPLYPLVSVADEKALPRAFTQVDGVYLAHHGKGIELQISIGCITNSQIEVIQFNDGV
ncbi:MAG: hypothetical protein IPP33_12685 [Flavobacteriales bacterium]|nr:hypothetical protein [Flavobacteriales bacterium]